MQKLFRLILLTAVVAALFASVSGQNKFEGYSLVIDSEKGNSCPIRYQSSGNSLNAIDVFVAGTKQANPATGLTACDGSRLAGGTVFPNGDGRWCFSGSEPFYDIKLRNGTTYLWPATTKETGFYNVKDFRPVTRNAA